MKIGLFFGSFNPIHIGHLIIGNCLINFTDLNKVWYVVSPQNPFKSKNSLLNKFDRLHLVELAVEDNEHLESCNIEFSLPTPSYTIDTLLHLEDKYPEKSFSLIMGSDNLKSFHKWKNYELILNNYKIVVYRRLGSHDHDLFKHPNIEVLDVPYIQISSTFIRESLKSGYSMRYFLRDNVLEYIEKMNYYR